jgi:hypothetical protein
VGGERVLEDEVEHGPDGVDVELRAVDLVHLHAAERLPHHLGVAEVLGAVGREGHRRPQRRDETEIDEVGAAVVDDDVLGLDVLVPEAPAVIDRELREQVGDVARHLPHLRLAEPAGARLAVHLPRDDPEVLARVVGHHVEEPHLVHVVLEHETELLGALEGP